MSTHEHRTIQTSNTYEYRKCIFYVIMMLMISGLAQCETERKVIDKCRTIVRAHKERALPTLQSRIVRRRKRKANFKSHYHLVDAIDGAQRVSVCLLELYFTISQFIVKTQIFTLINYLAIFCYFFSPPNRHS